MNKPEILSPAGNMEKLKSALLYGADAVYFAGKQFGMRASADNFTIEEIGEACAYTHSLGKKLYLTVNVFAMEDDVGAIKSYLRDIKSLGDVPDAIICAELGVTALIREIMPEMEIHISTQANTQNSVACTEWYKLGARRIILARELPLETIKRIRDNTPSGLELEVFVHGAMCMSYSGRCMLSNYLVGRNANSGMCAQPCRWNYYLVEEKRLELPLPVEEYDGATTIFSSRDLCMISHIPELVESGVNSFKIEGRMKSAYYTASVTNAYRIALDSYCEDPAGYENDERLKEEVESVSHREYDTGYFFAKPSENAKICENPVYIREKAYLGICTGYEDGLAVFEQRNKVISGMKAQILSPGQLGRDVIIEVLYDGDNNIIESAPHPFMVFKIKADFPVAKGDILRSV